MAQEIRIAQSDPVEDRADTGTSGVVARAPGRVDLVNHTFAQLLELVTQAPCPLALQPQFDLPDIIPRLVYVALRTPPMPERLLKLRLA